MDERRRYARLSWKLVRPGMRLLNGRVVEEVRHDWKLWGSPGGMLATSAGWQGFPRCGTVKVLVGEDGQPVA
jgi:hypothetical protein